jgi:hypothetical protein
MHSRSSRLRTPAVSALHPPLQIDEDGRVLVEIRADVTPRLQREIGRLRGEIVSRSALRGELVAWMPLAKLETLAGTSGVRSIQPAVRRVTSRTAAK